MIQSNIKWSITSTEGLIRAKHSEEMFIKFSEAMGKPQKMKMCWQMIGEKLELPVSGDIAKIKYNQLLAKYREVLAESNRSGAAAPKWKYWDIFKVTFPSNIQHSMQDVVELGDESNSNQSMLTVSTTSESNAFVRDKSRKTNDYKDTKKKVFEAILKKYENSETEISKTEVLEKRIESLEEKINLLIKLQTEKKDSEKENKNSF